MRWSYLALGVVAVLADLAIPAQATPTVAECERAGVEFADVLMVKPEAFPEQQSGLTVRVFSRAYPDFASITPPDQWKLVSERLSNAIIWHRIEVAGDAKFHYQPTPEGLTASAKWFLMLDTLEICLRPAALAASPDVETDIADFDSKFPSDLRAGLRSKMRARL